MVWSEVVLWGGGGNKDEIVIRWKGVDNEEDCAVDGVENVGRDNVSRQ